VDYRLPDARRVHGDAMTALDWIVHNVLPGLGGIAAGVLVVVAFYWATDPYRRRRRRSQFKDTS
jgi:formate/nitrite transporter FocA (FNT family)